MNQVKNYFHRGENVSTAVEMFTPRWKCFHCGGNDFHRGDNYFHRGGNVSTAVEMFPPRWWKHTAVEMFPPRWKLFPPR